MSRLLPSDVKPILTGMEEYDRLFVRQTGKTMFELAAMAVGTDMTDWSAKGERVAVVPITSGLGLISHFSAAVCEILRHYGLDSFVTESTDVTGFYEAYRRGAEMVFMADDDTFSAVSMSGHAISDNGYATGVGFAQALYLAMTEKERPVLVLGAGPVGKNAAAFLAKKGCRVFLYDRDWKKAIAAEKEIRQKTDICLTTGEKSANQRNVSQRIELAEQKKTKGSLEILREKPVYRRFRYLFDATTAKEFLRADDVEPDTVIAAPGMPCGITGEARQIATVIHNPLELGTLTMYFDCRKREQTMGKVIR